VLNIRDLVDVKLSLSNAHLANQASTLFTQNNFVPPNVKNTWKTLILHKKKHAEEEFPYEIYQYVEEKFPDEIYKAKI
jgi:hypothetical protein